MIAIVDDDVWFAEELQDLLILQGCGSVVVVSQPEGSSLTLLSAAQVLIIDVVLGATTAVAVLEHVRKAGGMPKVIFMSGGGAKVIDGAVQEASSRGFLVVSGMEKSVVADELSDLIGKVYVPTTFRRLPQRAPETSAPAATEMTSVVSGLSLQYVGARVQRELVLTGSVNEAAVLAGTTQYEARKPEQFVEASLTLQRTLELNGHSGLLFTPVPGDVVRDTEYRRALCSSYRPGSAALSRIVLELDMSGCVDFPRLCASISELRFAGFGVLLRCSLDELPPIAALAMIPITVLEISEPGRRDKRALSETMRMLRRQAIGSICKVGRSFADLDQLRGLGFSLIDTGIELTLLQGDQRGGAPSLAWH